MKNLCIEDLVQKFSNHAKVLDAIRNKRFICVKPSSDSPCTYIYRGVDRDYLVVRCRFCTCIDFLINVLSRRMKPVCYHIPALEIALQQNAVREFVIDVEVFKEIVREVLLIGFSTTLRRVLR